MPTNFFTVPARIIMLLMPMLSAVPLMAESGSIVTWEANGARQENLPTNNGDYVKVVTGDDLSPAPAGVASTEAPCVICPPPPATFPEAEPCGANFNQGCPLGGPPPQPTECGQSVCGTFWRSASSRDVDAYEITLTNCTCITWTVDSDALVDIFLLSGTCTLIKSATGVCSTVVSDCLQPGVYRLLVAPSFSNPVFDCNSPLRHYVATLACEPCPTSVCCEKGSPPFQVIQLLSGQVNGLPGLPGGLDDSIRYSAPGTPTACTGGTLHGSYGQGLNLPYTNAVSGPQATVVAPHPAPWLPALVGPNNAANARWINSTIDPASVPSNQGSPGQSVLYCHPFTVSTPRPPKSACMTFIWAVDDHLGDPVGPLPSGVYLHRGGLNLLNPPVGLPISGGTYNAQTTTTINFGPGQLALGSNKLFIYQHNVNNNPGCQASGVMYYAQIEICELCDAGDVNCNGVVDIDDLLSVISGWGPCAAECPPCPPDVNFDCTVNIGDLLTVIQNWG